MENAKPDPEPVRLACDKLGIEPSQAYMVGDSMEDMEAGSRAGCRTIGIGVDGDIRIESIGKLLDIIQSSIRYGPIQSLPIPDVPDRVS